MSLLSRLGGNQQDKEVRHEKLIKRSGTPKHLSELEVRLHNFLVDELKKAVNQNQEIEPVIERLSDEFLVKEGNHLTFEEKEQLKHDISYELTGYGPISPLLADSTDYRSDGERTL